MITYYSTKPQKLQQLRQSGQLKALAEKYFGSDKVLEGGKAE